LIITNNQFKIANSKQPASMVASGSLTDIQQSLSLLCRETISAAYRGRCRTGTFRSGDEFGRVLMRYSYRMWVLTSNLLCLACSFRPQLSDLILLICNKLRYCLFRELHNQYEVHSCKSLTMRRLLLHLPASFLTGSVSYSVCKILYKSSHKATIIEFVICDNRADINHSFSTLVSADQEVHTMVSTAQGNSCGWFS
jgi:hypothetical protein